MVDTFQYLYLGLLRGLWFFILSIIAIYFIFQFAEMLKTFFSDLITHLITTAEINILNEVTWLRNKKKKHLILPILCARIFTPDSLMDI